MRLKIAFLFFCLTPIICSAQNQLWSQLYDGAQFWRLVQDEDGHFLAVGNTVSIGNYGLLWKYDHEGMTVLQQIYYTGTGLNDAIPEENGECTLVGYYHDPATWNLGGWILRTDSLGSSLWQRFYADPNLVQHRTLYSICRSPDGCYVAGGREADQSFEHNIGWILKLDESGDTLWSRLYDVGYYFRVTDLVSCPGGGYFAAGNVKDTEEDTTYAPLLMRINEDGDTLWTKRYDFISSASLRDLLANQDQGFVAVGSIGFYNIQPWFAHLDETGDTLDFITYNYGESSYFTEIAPSPPGNWVMAGGISIEGNQQALVQLCDDAGDTLWTANYGGPDIDWVDGMVVDEDHYIYCAGSANFDYYSSDGWIFKIDPTQPGVFPAKGIDPPQRIHLDAHPNPFNHTTAIRFELPAAGWVKLEVFDVAGRVVGAVRQPPLHHQWLNPGIHNITFDGTSLASGIYIYRLSAGEFTASGKMLLLK